MNYKTLIYKEYPKSSKETIEYIVIKQSLKANKELLELI